MPVFKTGAINRSATSPELLQFYYSTRFPLASAYNSPAEPYGGFQHRLFQPITRPSGLGLHHFTSPDWDCLPGQVILGCSGADLYEIATRLRSIQEEL